LQSPRLRRAPTVGGAALAPTRENVVIVGAGQAGLATSFELSRRNVDHVVLERGQVGQSWRDRWDSFCLVLPNWTLMLPGHAYDGPEPDAFLPREGIVSYLEDYSRKSSGELREGVAVASLEQSDDGFLLRTTAGDIDARAVVLSTGAYQRPHRPPGIGTLPPGCLVLDAEGYTKPSALPEGAVLVVGSGQTGCQIAEELRLAGRDVYLACGKTSWMLRRLAGRDMMAWVYDSGFFEQRLADLPPLTRLAGNPQASGRDGGHDLHYRTLQAIGVQLVGRLAGADDRRFYFAPDLAESVAAGDARYIGMRDLIAAYCARSGIPMPEVPDPPPFDASAPEHLDASGVGAVVFTSGFRPDYTGWVRIPTFDADGFPVCDEGQSIAARGLYFVGVHFMRKRKSSLFIGVGEDAEVVAEQISRAG
jgi:putative flavoprotein involved in K+ transport